MSNQSLYTAAAGLRAQQQSIDTLASNIANVNTAGYKRSRVNFSDAVYRAMLDPSKPLSGQDENLQLGHGVLAQSIQHDFGTGQLEETSRSLDFALTQAGFFALSGEDGQTVYTRSGAFQSQPQGGSNVLVTADGRPVLDREGGRIASAKALDEIEVDSFGNLSLDGEALGALGIYTFANPQGLEALGDGVFAQTVQSGAAEAGAGDVRQGWLERSNTDLTEEMTDLIAAQRAYAFLSRAVSTADEMRQIENNIRR